MASRQPRSSGVSTPSVTSGRSYPAVVRPRTSGALSLVHRAAADYRNLSVTGIRGSSSLATTSPIRATRSGTHTSALSNRTSPRSLTTFEPRVIRAETSQNSDSPCAPSSSTPPTRTQRSGGSDSKFSTVQSSSAGPRPSTPPPSNTFPRPSYLEHSSLRDFLQPEALSDALPSPPLRTVGEAQFNVTRRRASPSQLDSDDEGTFSPPREASLPPYFSHYPILRLPTRWSDQTRHLLLSISSDGRELSYQGPSNSGEKDAAAARTIHPIPPACGIYYYEVEIVSKGQRGHISIGFAGPDVRLSRLPGWEKNSWGYYGDDGLSFAAERTGMPYGPMFGTGDVIGCGIDFSQNRVFYTKNGTFIGLVFENVGKDGDIYPSVGLLHNGEAVRVNFGQDPFKFDIEYHVQQQRNQIWAKIQSTPVDRLLAYDNMGGKTETIQSVSEKNLKVRINRLVLLYLAHHGYTKTTRAFQTQCEKQGLLDRRIARPSIPSSVEDFSMEIDGSSSSGGDIFDTLGPGMREEDIELRTRIANSVIAGDIDTALAETKRHYPAVLEREEGLMLFKLRCRKFVELMVEAAEIEKRIKSGGDISEEDEWVDGMDVDDYISPPPQTATNGYGGSAAISIRGNRTAHAISEGRRRSDKLDLENALQTALMYGQTLDSDYNSDRRPEVTSLFARVTTVLKHHNPMEAGGDVAEIVGHEARVTLANELSQAILRSQGQPGQPALEQLYRQTSACILQLGLSGVGAAAFADMPKEFLDAD